MFDLVCEITSVSSGTLTHSYVWCTTNLVQAAGNITSFSVQLQ